MARPGSIDDKLADLVLDLFHPKAVKVAPSLSVMKRATINRSPSPTGRFLSQFPQLALVGNKRVVLLSLATGFRKVQGQRAVRTIDLAAFQVAENLAKAGYEVAIVHKPHGHGAWITDAELGWNHNPNTVSEATMVIGWVNTMQTGKEFGQDGWPPSLELTGPWVLNQDLGRLV